MIDFRSKKYVLAALVCLVSFSMFSCRSSKQLTKANTAVKPMSAGKLIRNIEGNAFDYRHFSIKRISCQFDNGKSKASFRAAIQAEKGKQITVMLSKLNISVGRGWLTPDSVKFINYLEKNYFLDDYSFLSSMLDMDIDFATVNAIISNNIFSVHDEKVDDQKYNVRADSGMYILESVRDPKESAQRSPANERRQLKRASKQKSNDLIRQSVYVDPDFYKVRKIVVVDPGNARKLVIDFKDFVEVDKKQSYPGEISLHLDAPDSYVDLQVKLAGFSTKNEKEVRFKVPEKYTRINQFQK